MTGENEIKALIELLDDPDPDIQSAVYKRLSEIGGSVIPSLEKTWETSINQGVQERLELIIQDIQYNEVCDELRNWVNEGCIELLIGATIIARFQFPELKYQVISQIIEKIKTDIEAEMNFSLTPLEKVRVINHVFFELHKFSGNYSNYYSPNNYYINHVIETHKGSPIALAVIYISVAQLLNLPIVGVNLPKNFIVAYKNEESNDVLFYANPYNKGAILGRREIEYFLKQQNIVNDESYFLPCNNLKTIERIVRNLISSYESTGQKDKLERFKLVLKILEL